jgi:hypothetical protein
VPAGAIIFGRRNILNWDNGANINFTFNSKMNLAFRARHYWSRVNYDQFYILNKKGGVDDTDYTGKNAYGEKLHDITANYFNIDCIFTWRFAPGSDLIFVWKNAIYNEFQAEFHKYGRDLIDLPQNPQTNGLSLKMLYWLDYATLKRKI